VVRHDVDRKPGNAVSMAKLERDLGVRTTYYFRVVGSAFCPRSIGEIDRMGHEIGYHYEDLAMARGNLRAAHRLFAENLASLRRLAPIRTIAMHGSPLSRHDNQALWQEGSLADYGLVADAFTTIDYRGMHYFTDTGRAWNSGSANLRDRPATAAPPPGGVRSTDDLVRWVEAHRPPRLAVSAHPERWARSSLDWFAQWGKDSCANAIKRALRVVR